MTSAQPGQREKKEGGRPRVDPADSSVWIGPFRPSQPKDHYKPPLLQIRRAKFDPRGWLKMLHGQLHWVGAQCCSGQQMRLVDGVFLIF